MLRAIQNSLFSLIYPQKCRVCSNSVDEIENGIACRKCWDDTRVFTGREMLCDKCGAFLGDDSAIVSVRCMQCDDYSFEKAVAIGVYEKALAATIVNLKSSPHLNRTIRSLISQTVANRPEFTDVDVIIPIPLSKLRLRERGFNQAETIAAEVSYVMGISVDSGSLARKLHTPIHRVGMDQKARELTVKNAFEVVRPKLIASKNILLVDDVLTSGATSSFCARVLKKNGAQSVNVFTLARAVMH
jgi:competence protein ComFC